MLFFELFETQVSCGFIVAHVVIPCSAKFQELTTLSTFHCDKLLLLRLTHVLKLTKHFLVFQVVELELRFSRLWQIQILAALLTVVIQQPRNYERISF